MTKLQEAKTNMYRSTQQVCNSNSAITIINIPFTTASGLFAELISAILGTTTNQVLKLTGITDSKTSKKETVCKLASEAAGIITAYADVQGDDDMLAKVHFPFSELMRLKDDEVVPVIQNIFNIASDNAVALAPYGIDTARLDALQTAMDNFSGVVPSKKTAISGRKSKGTELKQLFVQADRILKMRMDKLIVVFNEDNPDFVSTYRNARVLYDPAYRKRKSKEMIKAA